MDGGDAWVIIEAKPLYHQHASQQLTREVIDTVAATGASKVALIMVGADLGGHPDQAAWEQQIKSELYARRLEANVGLAYSSWAQLGACIESCGNASPEWAAYAEDVVRHLKSKALLGYKGVDVFEGLIEFNLATVIEGYNRVILAARQFFLALHRSERFLALGLQPRGSRGFEMLRDDPSSVITQYPDWFTTSTMISPYSHPNWQAGAGALAGFFFDETDAYLVTGAFVAPTMADFAVTFAESENVELDELNSAILRQAGAPEVATPAKGRKNEFRYGSRVWSGSHATADMEWTLVGLEQVVSLLNGKTR